MIAAPEVVVITAFSSTGDAHADTQPTLTHTHTHTRLSKMHSNFQYLSKLLPTVAGIWIHDRLPLTNRHFATSFPFELTYETDAILSVPFFFLFTGIYLTVLYVVYGALHKDHVIL